MKKNNGLTDEGIAGCWAAIRTYHHDTKLATRSRELLQAELTRLRRENEELKEALRGIVSNPRWLSIGSIDNTAEIRISKETHKKAIAMCYPKDTP